MSEVAPEPKRLSIFNGSTPKSVKTLRRKFRRGFKLPDGDNMLKEQTGQSDRAAVLITAALLDDLLAFKIGTAFKFDFDEAEFEKIFRFEGPLGSFSARLEVAVLFGVIEDETFQQLNIIRELRNACAHSTEKVNLEDSEFANVIHRLIAPPIGFTTPDIVSSTRNQFVLEAAFLARVLVAKGREVARAEYMLEVNKIRAQLHDASPDKPPQP